MKKYIITLFLVLNISITSAQCWDNIELYPEVEKSGNSFNYTFYLYRGFLSKCVKDTWFVFDYGHNKLDTIYQNKKDFAGFSVLNFDQLAVNKHSLTLKFKHNGNFKIMSKLSMVNIKQFGCCPECVGCKDTIFSVNINVPSFSKFTINETPLACNIIQYQLSDLLGMKDDWCYYTRILKHPFLDSIKNSVWDTITRSGLKPSIDSLHINSLDSFYNNLKFDIRYPKDGRYLLISRVSRCSSGEDTLVYRKIFIDCAGVGVSRFEKRERKLVEIYDLLGRKVSIPRKNEILIYLYNDNTKQKVVSLE